MKGVVLTGHGGFEKLQWRDDLPTPKPGPGDVLVRVAAAGVNNTDINTRIGWYSKSGQAANDASWAGVPLEFPRIQGIDVCGRIEAVGEGVDPARVGERVLIEPCLREAGGATLEQPWFLGSECDGGFADYTVVAARHAYSVTSGLSDIELASFPCSYSTAENVLTRCSVGEGDRVLITGASGGVGSAAIQLARARGASVLAVTSGTKAAKLKGLGADICLDRSDDLLANLGPNTVDVIVDLVAGASWPRFLEILKPGGRYGVAGAIAGPIVELDLRSLYLKDLSFFGCTALDAGVFTNLVRLIETDAIKPLVAETYPLREIAKAQASFLEKGYIGKIVLDVAG
ncbi:MAG: alcohol dehydrogenase family protein [Magnetovibrionaceae bacterium]